jgi:hypothetical protein
MNNSIQITRNNFSDYLDKANGYAVASMVFKQQSRISVFSRESAEKIAYAFEKPWKHPELFVPALNEVLIGSMSLWEIHDGDSPWVACGECVFSWLTERGVDYKLGENYEDESQNLYISEDVFHQLAQSAEVEHICEGCGVSLE